MWYPRQKHIKPHLWELSLICVDTLKRHSWSMFRLPVSMCISPTSTEQDVVAIRNSHIGIYLYIRQEDVVVDAICFCLANFSLCSSTYSAMMTPPHYP
jgi:hypothetical protein